MTTAAVTTPCAGTTRRGACRLPGTWKVDAGAPALYCRPHAEQAARRARRDHIYSPNGHRLRRVPLAPRPPHQRIDDTNELADAGGIVVALAAARDDHDLHLCRQAIIRGRHYRVDALWPALRAARRRIELARLTQIENARHQARENGGEQ